MSGSLERQFVRSPNVRLKPVGKAMAVYVPAQKAIHVLNPTAQLLFDLLAEPISEAQLIEALDYATDADSKTIAADVETTLTDFLDKGLIVETTT